MGAVSIRTRLAVAVALVLAVSFILLGVIIVRSTRATLVGQVDDQVRENAARMVEPPPSDHGGRAAGNHGPYWITAQPNATPETGTDTLERTVASFVYSPKGVQLVNDPCGFQDDPRSPPEIPPIPSPEVTKLMNRIVTTPAVDDSFSYRMLVLEDRSGNVVVTAAPLDRVNAAISRLIRIFFIVGAGALVAAALVSWWLIRRGLRPVDRMVDAATGIAAGDLSRRVAAANPRTELGRLGTALNEMMGQIERALRARMRSEERLRQFVADAAHELRTPLTSLRGYAELYRQGALTDEAAVANAMGRIEAEGARMARLVDDLLLLARLDQQRGIELVPVDLVPIVADAVSDLRAIDPARPVSVDLVTSAIVRGDTHRLRQIMDNLLTNARIHTPPGTPVHVVLAQQGQTAVIVVRDEGPGIAASDRERVFERFWRADPGRGRAKGGSGLGLAIVASLVGVHNGTIEITSEPGTGAAFTVRLPLANSAEARQDNSA